MEKNNESKVSGDSSLEVKCVSRRSERRQSGESDADREDSKVSESTSNYFLRHTGLTPIHEENSARNDRSIQRRRKCFSLCGLTPQAREKHIERNGNVSIGELKSQVEESFMKKIERLEQKLADVNGESQELMDEKQKLVAKYEGKEERLTQQLETMNKTTDALQSENQTLMDEKQALMGKNQFLVDENQKLIDEKRKQDGRLEKQIKEVLAKQRSIDEEKTQKRLDEVEKQLEQHGSNLKTINKKLQLEGHSEPTVEAIQISETETAAVPDGEDAAVEQASHVFDDN